MFEMNIGAIFNHMLFYTNSAQVSFQQTTFTVEEGNLLTVCVQLLSTPVPALIEDGRVNLTTVMNTAESPGKLVHIDISMWAAPNSLFL